MSKTPSSWFQRLTRRLMRFSRTKAGLGTLGLAGFLETTVFPIMIEAVAIPMMLAHRKRIPEFVLVIAVGTTLGAALTYYIGYYLFESLGLWFINAFDYQTQYESFKLIFAEYGFWAILGVGLLPIPFHIAMLTAGTAGYPFYLFVIAAAISRLIRYTLLGSILYFYGYHVRAWQRKWRREEALKKAQ